ncbi:MAG: Co2+/Mg2+ efflux protein ApaG [Flavobacteriales bacterium]|jgi:ApaG protein
MLTEVTAGVRISVEARYEPVLSSPMMDSYIFSYFIKIRNENDHPVQLLRRHWFIFDSSAMRREVEGPGVVGEQPVIAPGEEYTYRSACDLRSVRGSMHGFYTMRNTEGPSFFRVSIPRFIMEVPHGLN